MRLPALILLAACASPALTEEGGAEESRGGEAAEAAAVFVIAPLTLLDDSGRSLALDAEGVLHLGAEDTPAPHFWSTGEVTLDGETVARMSEDGVLRTNGGSEIAVVEEDGTARIGEQTLRFNASGELVGTHPGAPRVTLSPADSPAKRVAMAAMILMTLVSHAETSEPVELPASN